MRIGIGAAALTFIYCLHAHAIDTEKLGDWRLGLRTQVVSNNIEFLPRSGPVPEGAKLTYRPPQANYLGVIAGYKWLAGTIWFGISASEAVQSVEGTGKYSDMSLSYIDDGWGIEGHYSNYRGYLIDNSSRLSAATLAGAQYFKIPDMEAIGGGLNFYYSLDAANYSLAAAFDQSSIPKKSGGAGVLLASLRYQRIRNSSRIIPSELATDFGVDAAIDTAEMVNYGAGAGYGHYWRPGIFFFSPFLGATVGYQKTTWTMGASPLIKTSPAFNVHFKLALGVNLTHYLFTINVTADRFQQVTESIEIGNTLVSSTISVGVRF